MFTASEIWKLCGKKGLGDTGTTYIHEKVSEFITGERKQQASTMATEWGNNNEKDAYLWFVQETKIEAKYHGKEDFVFLEYNQFSGGSPDGFFDNGVLEIKCPFVTSNHVAALSGGIDWLRKKDEYYCQLQFNMMCAKAEKGILVSYDPRTIEPQHRMALIDVEPDIDLQLLIHSRIEQAAEIVKSILNKIK